MLRVLLFSTLMLLSVADSEAQNTRGTDGRPKAFLTRYPEHIRREKGLLSMRRTCYGYVGKRRLMIWKETCLELYDTYGRDTMVVFFDATGRPLKWHRVEYLATSEAQLKAGGMLQYIARIEFYDSSGKLTATHTPAPGLWMNKSHEDSTHIFNGGAATYVYDERGFMKELFLYGSRFLFGVPQRKKRLYARYTFDYTFR